MTTVREVGTGLGTARLHVTDGGASGTLVLGHGAGGGVESVDLVAVTTAAAEAGWRVLRVEQPWRVAGKRVAPTPPRLDDGWRAVLEHARDGGLLTGRLVLGGRSAGARVACRTAAEHRADGVLALAFPLHPPGRPEKSRRDELTGVQAPLVVVQGETDAMGRPEAIAAVLSGRANASVYAVSGDHSLRRDVNVVAAAALSWMTELTA
jgi:predicted alpha/beta-hydrolase family hydrolase